MQIHPWWCVSPEDAENGNATKTKSWWSRCHSDSGTGALMMRRSSACVIVRKIHADMFLGAPKDEDVVQTRGVWRCSCIWCIGDEDDDVLQILLPVIELQIPERCRWCNAKGNGDSLLRWLFSPTTDESSLQKSVMVSLFISPKLMKTSQGWILKLPKMLHHVILLCHAFCAAPSPTENYLFSSLLKLKVPGVF